MDIKDFTKGIESLINPSDVGSIHLMHAFNHMVPKVVQTYSGHISLISKGGEQTC